MPGKPERIAEIRQTFTELWSLEKDSDDCSIDVIEKAIKSPNKFVLKAQIQQGKGVYFGNDMVEKLRSLSDDELGAHILQSKILPYNTKVGKIQFVLILSRNFYLISIEVLFAKKHNLTADNQ